MRFRRDFLANFLADFQAGKFRQHQIEDEKIGRSLADLREAGGTIAAGGDLVTVFFQVVAHQLDDVFVVFDDQNTFHLGDFSMNRRQDTGKRASEARSRGVHADFLTQH